MCEGDCGNYNDCVRTSISILDKSFSYCQNINSGPIILTEKLAEQNVFFLAPTASGTSFAFVQMNLRGLNLKNIDILQNYPCLQVIDLSCNNLQELSVLGNLQHLQILNVSWNSLSELLAFKPPLSLRKALYGNNQISTMPSLTSHWALKELCLDFNIIEAIEGLENCESLTTLSLIGNHLTEINGLDHLQIRYLHMSHNAIENIDNLQKLFFLQEVDLAYNRIKHLEGLKNHIHLRKLIIHSNDVQVLEEIKHLRRLFSLRILDMRFNPIAQERKYFTFICFHLPLLELLDCNPINSDEKVSAINLINPPLDVTATKDHLVNQIFNFSQLLHVKSSTSEWGKCPYNIFVLVGPTGSGKASLVTALVNENPTTLGRGISHTTRACRSTEIPEFHYYFTTIRSFDNWQIGGQFIETAQLYGEKYALSWFAIEQVATNRRSCITHMELEGVMSLNCTHFKPKMLFVMPASKSIHENRLENVKCAHESVVKEALARRNLYLKFHQEHPGFFTAFINNNNPDRALQKISQIITQFSTVNEEKEDEFRIASHWKPNKRILGELEQSSLNVQRRRARLAFSPRETEPN